MLRRCWDRTPFPVPWPEVGSRGVRPCQVPAFLQGPNGEGARFPVHLAPAPSPVRRVHFTARERSLEPFFLFFPRSVIFLDQHLLTPFVNMGLSFQFILSHHTVLLSHKSETTFSFSEICFILGTKVKLSPKGIYDLGILTMLLEFS